MSNISGDVIIDFSIEKDNKKVTSGSDTIYLGSFEEKTEQTKIFIPNYAESGVYEFVIQVNYGEYKAVSRRTVEIEVKEDTAIITPIDEKRNSFLNYMILIMLTIIAIILALILIKLYKEKQERKSTGFSKKDLKKFKPKESYAQRLVSAVSGENQEPSAQELISQTTNEEQKIKNESAREIVDDIKKEINEFNKYKNLLKD